MMARLAVRSRIVVARCASLAGSFAVCLSLTGCAARQLRPNYIVPVSAVSDVTLVHCDPETKPLVCERIAVTYRLGSERLVLPKNVLPKN
jgi:hypothetical protein